MTDIQDIRKNKYYQQASNVNKNSATTGFMQGFSTASGAFAWSGGWSVLAGLAGGVIGLFASNHNAMKDYNASVSGQRDLYVNNMKKMTKDRNRSILFAQKNINSTRSAFDSKYGEGMYDKYDDLFQNIFNIKDGNTVSDFLSNMKFDKVAGQIQSSTKGFDMSQASNVLSLSDFNEYYYEYMANEVKKANTAYGMNARMMSAKEKELYEDYKSAFNSFQLQVANQFKDTFYNFISQNAQGEISAGSASASEGASGLRQTGKLTSLQEFQNDLAKVAYSSNLNYLVSNYFSSLTQSNRSLYSQVEDIRRSQSISDMEFISGAIDAYNRHNEQLLEGMTNIKDSEGAIEETNKEVNEMEDYLDFTKNTHSSNDSKDLKKKRQERVEMEDIF